MNKDDIFIKHDGNSHQKQNPLSKKDIMDSIPPNALSKCDLKLAESKTEWRWRIFKFPNKKNEIVEISYKKPFEDRMYINKSGDWITSQVDDFYDKFVTNEFYSYSE
jgi:hypothetical protein